MKQAVILLAVFTISLFSQSPVHAQLKLSPGSSIAGDIRKVVDDYPNHFSNITGELIIQNPQSADYTCNFKVSGAEECVITKYSGKDDNVFSWRAVMLTTEDFEDARKKFKSLYNQLNNLSVKSSHLKGRYESPSEEKKFTTVLFSLDAGDESLKKLKVELILEAELMEWKVKVLIYDREREDDEQGKVIE